MSYVWLFLLSSLPFLNLCPIIFSHTIFSYYSFFFSPSFHSSLSLSLSLHFLTFNLVFLFSVDHPPAIASHLLNCNAFLLIFLFCSFLYSAFSLLPTLCFVSSFSLISLFRHHFFLFSCRAFLNLIIFSCCLLLSLIFSLVLIFFFIFLSFLPSPFSHVFFCSFLFSLFQTYYILSISVSSPLFHLLSSYFILIFEF